MVENNPRWSGRVQNKSGIPNDKNDPMTTDCLESEDRRVKPFTSLYKAVETE